MLMTLAIVCLVAALLFYLVPIVLLFLPDEDDPFDDLNP